MGKKANVSLLYWVMLKQAAKIPLMTLLLYSFWSTGLHQVCVHESILWRDLDIVIDFYNSLKSLRSISDVEFSSFQLLRTNSIYDCIKIKNNSYVVKSHRHNKAEYLTNNHDYDLQR